MAEEKTTTTPKAEQKESDLMKVRLLAKLYEQPILDGNNKVTGYRKFTQGGIVYVTKDEFNALNEFKQSFEEVAD